MALFQQWDSHLLLTSTLIVMIITSIFLQIVLYIMTG